MVSIHLQTRQRLAVNLSMCMCGVYVGFPIPFGQCDRQHQRHRRVGYGPLRLAVTGHLRPFTQAYSRTSDRRFPTRQRTLYSDNQAHHRLCGSSKLSDSNVLAEC
jgi:hypothetical protein